MEKGKGGKRSLLLRVEYNFTQVDKKIKSKKRLVCNCILGSSTSAAPPAAASQGESSEEIECQEQSSDHVGHAAQCRRLGFHSE